MSANLHKLNQLHCVLISQSVHKNSTVLDPVGWYSNVQSTFRGHGCQGRKRGRDRAREAKLTESIHTKYLLMELERQLKLC
jgi:hypothetical protein